MVGGGKGLLKEKTNKVDNDCRGGKRTQEKTICILEEL